MPKAFEEVAKEAMSLTARQRVALAGFLLESAEAVVDPGAEAEWDNEIRDRIRAIDDGRVAGIAHEEVMRAANDRRSQ